LPDERLCIQPVAVLDRDGLHPLVNDISGMKIELKVSWLAPFEDERVLTTTWSNGSPDPDSYTLEVKTTEIGKLAAGERAFAAAQCHLYIVTSADGQQFATGGGIYRTWKGKTVDEKKTDTQVYLWDRALVKRPVDLNTDVGPVVSMSFTPDGSKLLVATSGKSPVLVVIDTGQARIDHKFFLDVPATSVAVSSDRPVAAAVVGGKATFFDLEGYKWTSAPMGGGARSVAFGRDGASFYVGGTDGQLRRYVAQPLAGK